jgi:hypothetical protein
MAVVYYKIGQALAKQNKYMKNACSNPGKRSAPGSSFSILKFIQNRRAFLVCLITVLFYAIGNIPMTIYFILKNIAEEDHFLFYHFLRLDWVFGKSSECCWFAFSKSSHIWKIGQKIAHILETLPQEETETTRRLIRQSLV